MLKTEQLGLQFSKYHKLHSNRYYVQMVVYGSLIGHIMVPCNRISKASCQMGSKRFLETSTSKKYLLRRFDFVILSETNTVQKLWLVLLPPVPHIKVWRNTHWHLQWIDKYREYPWSEGQLHPKTLVCVKFNTPGPLCWFRLVYHYSHRHTNRGVYPIWWHPFYPLPIKHG